MHTFVGPGGDDGDHLGTPSENLQATLCRFHRQVIALPLSISACFTQ
jgi:hypothetical protein